MAEISVDQSLLISAPKDKVVIVSGGASGIGAATVTDLVGRGAHVYFCDLDDQQGRELEGKLSLVAKNGGGSVNFTSLDARDYNAQLQVFAQAYEKHGRVDIAIFSVGVADPTGWLSAANLTLESVTKVPKPLSDVIEINLTACLWFTRIALAYLKADFNPKQAQTGNQAPLSKSLILVSSANGFHEAPGLAAYSASKHGIIGIVRSLRRLTLWNFGVRLNAICPVATDTPMIAGAVDLLRSLDAPMNTTQGCVDVLIQTALDDQQHGKVVLVIKNRGIDIEEGLEKLQSGWLGEWASGELNRLQGILGPDTDWAQEHTQ
ncbi:hypothetical protein LTR72_008062 [Exophiala xenobiotica]|nr:hypothetical protein LTR72_008062 [Exophiala xenobiotica]KAK5288100.1 hypothetical protein LTR14_008437 [Exophiala xenobiotica]KAK5321995.1 hypothetical protein LTR93_006233 [Exophiala xenobiotica]